LETVKQENVSAWAITLGKFGYHLSRCSKTGRLKRLVRFAAVVLCCASLKAEPLPFMKTLITASGCACLLMLTGCSSTWQYVKLPDQTRKVEDASRGRIYVIRSSEAGAQAHVDILDGNHIVGSTGPRGYLSWEKEPGETVILSSSKGDSRLTLKVAAGEVYYVLQQVGPGRFYAKSSLEVVSSEQGQAALANSRSPEVRRWNSSPFAYMPPPTAISFTGAVGGAAPSGFSPPGFGTPSGAGFSGSMMIMR
jgi:hypothetical protein